MPDFKKPLTPEDLKKRQTTKSTRVNLDLYVSYILTIPEGGAGEVKLVDGESKPTIKRRVTMAASKVGKTAKYLRSSENELLFQLSAS